MLPNASFVTCKCKVATLKLRPGVMVRECLWRSSDAKNLEQCYRNSFEGALNARNLTNDIKRALYLISTPISHVNSCHHNREENDVLTVVR